MSYPLPLRNRRRREDFDIDRVLGEGSLSTVHIAVERATGKRVAMKMFEHILLNREKKHADVRMEEHCLRRANHPGIIKLYASFSDSDFHYMALELCPGGELWSMVKDVGCPDPLARHYLSQVLEAVGYLRDAGIVHRDLKAENVLIGDSGTAKLIDFGTARDLANPQLKGAGTKAFKKTLEDNVGTPNFMAPEVIRNKHSDFRSDIWSLGCMIFQVLSGLPPFYGGTLLRVYKKALAGALEFPPGMSVFGVKLIRRMVVKDPSARLGGVDHRQLQAHPFFVGVPFDGAHGRPLPVPSLEEICLLRVGRRWSQLGFRATALAAAQNGEPRCGVCLREKARAVLARYEDVSARLAGRGCEESTSLSSDSSDRDG